MSFNGSTFLRAVGSNYFLTTGFNPLKTHQQVKCRRHGSYIAFRHDIERCFGWRMPNSWLYGPNLWFFCHSLPFSTD